MLATSINVEWLFRCGHLLLPHTHSQLSTQSTHPLLCLGYWSFMDLVKMKDVEKVAMLPDIVDNEAELTEGWDAIGIDRL